MRNIAKRTCIYLISLVSISPYILWFSDNKGSVFFEELIKAFIWTLLVVCLRLVNGHDPRSKKIIIVSGVLVLAPTYIAASVAYSNKLLDYIHVQLLW